MQFLFHTWSVSYSYVMSALGNSGALAVNFKTGKVSLKYFIEIVSGRGPGTAKLSNTYVSKKL